MSISDEILGAYVDGELDAAKRAEVEAAMAADPTLAQRVERLRAVRDKLAEAFGETLHEPIPQRLIDVVQPNDKASSRVIDIAEARAYKAQSKATPRRWSRPAWGALAASVVAGIMLGYFLLKSHDNGFAIPQQGELLVRGGLADALSTQLASEQARDAAVRIGLTFQDKSGDYCRTFALQSGGSLAGLACREDNGWRVQALAQAEPAIGGAEPAGSALPAPILEAVKQRITGDPLDAAGEAAARQSNWETH